MAVFRPLLHLFYSHDSEYFENIVKNRGKMKRGKRKRKEKEEMEKRKKENK